MVGKTKRRQKSATKIHVKRPVTRSVSRAQRHREDSPTPSSQGHWSNHSSSSSSKRMSSSSVTKLLSFCPLVCLSPMEASIVPDSTRTDISKSHTRPPRGTIELFSGPPLQMPHQFTPLDREASVLRYREKKKTRKFQKTIRYASRKAYAETRPRIKGRFAKRTDVEFEVDQMFIAIDMAESGFGIVPSF